MMSVVMLTDLICCKCFPDNLVGLSDMRRKQSATTVRPLLQSFTPSSVVVPES